MSGGVKCGLIVHSGVGLSLSDFFFSICTYLYNEFYFFFKGEVYNKG